MFQYIAKEEVNLSNIAIFYGTMIAGEKSMDLSFQDFGPTECAFELFTRRGTCGAS